MTYTCIYFLFLGKNWKAYVMDSKSGKYSSICLCLTEKLVSQQNTSILSVYNVINLITKAQFCKQKKNKFFFFN